MLKNKNEPEYKPNESRPAVLGNHSSRIKKTTTIQNNSLPTFTRNNDPQCPTRIWREIYALGHTRSSESLPTPSPPSALP